MQGTLRASLHKPQSATSCGCLCRTPPACELSPAKREVDELLQAKCPSVTNRWFPIWVLREKRLAVVGQEPGKCFGNNATSHRPQELRFHLRMSRDGLVFGFGKTVGP